MLTMKKNPRSLLKHSVYTLAVAKAVLDMTFPKDKFRERFVLSIAEIVQREMDNQAQTLC